MKISRLLSITGMIFFASNASAQIATVDIVKGKQAYEKEVMYFYEQNWKAFRAEALREKFISGYQLIKTKADSTGYFNVILITRFADSASFKQVEQNFRPIMKKLSPKGPKMLNDVKRQEFLEFNASYAGSVIIQD